MIRFIRTFPLQACYESSVYSYYFKQLKLSVF